jgi:hypothetical protein
MSRIIVISSAMTDDFSPLLCTIRDSKTVRTQWHCMDRQVTATKHPILFLVNDQRDAQFFTTYFLFLFLFLFLNLYMFRAHRAHHQERQTVSTQPLVTVTLCRWPCRVQVGSQLLFTSDLQTTRPPTVTRGCVDTICLSWWWARCARNM